MKIIENNSWLKSFDPNQLIRQIIQNESYTHDFNPNRGYIRFSNGFTIQWGKVVYENNNWFGKRIRWPIKFKVIFGAVSGPLNVTGDLNRDLGVSYNNDYGAMALVDGFIIGIGLT